MANITDYLLWRGDLSFKQSPFNEVDNLILSELAYLEIDKKLSSSPITIQMAINDYLKRYNEKEIQRKFTLSKNPIPFFKALASSKRFGSLLITSYVNKISKKEEKQFSAMIIHLNWNTIYVSFKGTDNTLVGWKEDLNMSFLPIVPSQQEAVNYLNQNVSFKHRHIYLGGHSKGGNLAVYSAVNCKKKIQKRIKKVYNNDGPGFGEDFISETSYLKVVPKIVTILPETSIIGMLLTQKNEYKVIKSNSIGIWQHDSLTWQVEGNHFITIEEVDETSSKIKKMITDWLQNVDKKKREVFINTLFSILVNNKMNTVEDISKLKLRKIPGLVKEITKLDEETRKNVIETLKELMREANKNFDRKTILHGIKVMNKKDF